MAAIVARPGVVDAAADVKPGFLGDQQDAAATRAFWSAEVLDSHRRSSTTPSPHPVCILPVACGMTATRAWNSRGGIHSIHNPIFCGSMIFLENRVPPIGSTPRASFSGSCP